MLLDNLTLSTLDLTIMWRCLRTRNKTLNSSNGKDSVKLILLQTTKTNIKLYIYPNV